MTQWTRLIKKQHEVEDARGKKKGEKDLISKKVADWKTLGP